MLSRRTFLLGNLAALVAISDSLLAPPSLARRARSRKSSAVPSGPHELARREWPPAIVPDHLGVTDRGYCCFVDDVGRFAVVDMRRQGKSGPKVVGELNGLGKKVIDFVVTQGKAFVLASKEAEKDEIEHVVFVVNLSPITQPTVVATLPLPNYADPTCITVSQDLLCVGGTSASGENLVSVFGGALRRGRKGDQDKEMPSLARFTAEQPIASLNLQDRTLAVLQSGSSCKLDYLRLADPRNPEPQTSLKLDDDFKTMVRFRDTAVLIGTSTNGDSSSPARSKYVAQTVALEPQPHVVATLPLPSVVSVLDAAIDSSKVMLLAEVQNERAVVALGYDRKKNLKETQTLALPHPKGSYGQHSSIWVNNRTAMVASGWAGVQVLGLQGKQWAHQFDYTIPRLPASSLANWGDMVVLAGADLKLYNIGQPSRPELVDSTDLLASVKKIVGAGSFVLCLAKDSLSLRKMDQLGSVVATVPVTATQLAFDKVQQQAFLIKPGEKETTVTRYSVYSNSLAADKPFNVDGAYEIAYANGGYLLLAGLHDLAIYGTGGAKSQKAELIGSRHLENLAIRDLYLNDDNIVISAVDQNSKGFFLILSKDDKDLRVLGSLDLPHDAVALTSTKERAIVVGSTSEGKDLATIIDISAPATPKIISTLEVLEAVSAVTIKEKLAILAGRGLEIVSLG